MNISEYQQAALRTESKIDKLNYNKNYITDIFKLFVICSEILDAIKKELYYNNSKKSNETILVNLLRMEKIIECIRQAFPERHQFDNDTTLNSRLLHGCIGLSTESGELLDILIKTLEENIPVDIINVQEEISDGQWYCAIINDALGLSWEEGLERNIKKLKARFPEKFTEENAEVRNLDLERQILEGKNV